jgi:hypothetical protein
VDMVLGEEIEQFRSKFIARAVIEGHCDVRALYVYRAVADCGSCGRGRWSCRGRGGWLAADRILGAKAPGED